MLLLPPDVVEHRYCLWSLWLLVCVLSAGSDQAVSVCLISVVSSVVVRSQSHGALEYMAFPVYLLCSQSQVMYSCELWVLLMSAGCWRVSSTLC